MLIINKDKHSGCINPSEVPKNQFGNVNLEAARSTLKAKSQAAILAFFSKSFSNERRLWLKCQVFLATIHDDKKWTSWRRFFSIDLVGGISIQVAAWLHPYSEGQAQKVGLSRMLSSTHHCPKDCHCKKCFVTSGFGDFLSRNVLLSVRIHSSDGVCSMPIMMLGGSGPIYEYDFANPSWNRVWISLTILAHNLSPHYLSSFCTIVDFLMIGWLGTYYDFGSKSNYAMVFWMSLCWLWRLKGDWS